MNSTVTTGALAKLFDTTPKTIADLGKRGIIEKGSKRGTWALDASVTGYVKHLRAEAAARGGEEAAQARARLGHAQAALAEAKAAQLRSGLSRLTRSRSYGPPNCAPSAIASSASPAGSSISARGRP